MTQQHTDACKRDTDAQERDLAAYTLQWPNHCKRCDGYGGHVVHGVRYYSDGSGEPDSYDTCTCIDNGYCPRCNSKTFTVDLTSCSECNFNLDKPEGAPPLPECTCNNLEFDF